jgi:hypothetical protein
MKYSAKCVISLFYLVVAEGQTQTIRWTFNSAEATTNASDGVTAGVVQRVNGGSGGWLSGDSPSSTYVGASGGSNAIAFAQSGALNTNASTYFQFALVPSTNHVLYVSQVSFGSRSTSTGPKLFGLRSGLDGFARDLANGSLSADGKWMLAQASLCAVSPEPGTPVVFRLYGYGGTGSGSANWRIDDLAVAASAVVSGTCFPPLIALPEPQKTRVGETLSFVLSITPTDGDAVAYTNAVALTPIAGVWSLANGVFTYAPADADFGTHAFVFSVADKDGTNTATVAVTVRKRMYAAVPLSLASGGYMQTFDGLATNGADNAWDNAADPLPAWYAYADETAVEGYRTGTGSLASGGLYSFGASSVSTNRALGSLASSGVTYYYGVAFSNDSVATATNLSVAYTAQQWRVGASADTNMLVFEYCVTNAVQPLTEGRWHPVRALCFASLLATNATQTAGAVLSSSRLSGAIGYPIRPGQVVVLRWCDSDDDGSDHGFGIDDVSVGWSCGSLAEAIPVPRTGVAEDFDGMGWGDAAELPFLWRTEVRADAVRSTGAYSSAAECVQYTHVSSNFTHSGVYNFAGRSQFDRAVGGWPAADNVRSVTVFARFRNAAGMPVRNWSVGYSAEKYRNGTATAVRLLSSVDGQSWRAVGDAVSFGTDANVCGYAAGCGPGATARCERRAAFDAPIASDAVFYLAWQISAADGEASSQLQAVAIDDVCVAPIRSGANALLIK